MEDITTEQVTQFWESNPLCITLVPYKPGTLEFYKYYDKLREDIESIEYSYKLHEYLNFKGKKVLDIGCGNGYVLSKYAKEGADVYGIDITQTGINLSKKRFELLNLSGNFQVANAEVLPFEDNSFDCICSMGVLHHIPNIKKALEEIYRVLKPGGRLILMLYHKNSARYQIRYSIVSLFSKKTRQQLANEFDGEGNPKGAVYSKSDAIKLLNKFNSLEMFTGFMNGYHILPIFGFLFPDFILKPFKKRWGWNLYMKAYKPK